MPTRPGQVQDRPYVQDVNGEAVGHEYTREYVGRIPRVDDAVDESEPVSFTQEGISCPACLRQTVLGNIGNLGQIEPDRRLCSEVVSCGRCRFNGPLRLFRHADQTGERLSNPDDFHVDTPDFPLQVFLQRRISDEADMLFRRHAH